MNEIIENFTVTLHFQTKVDTNTGEVTTECIKKSIDKVVRVVEDKPKKKSAKPQKSESSTPMLILEDNKYSLNQAAVELMGVEPDCKLDIKYEQRGKQRVPVIGTDEAFGTKQGNRLTKSFTVACRGSKHEELEKYGTEFTLVPHESKEDRYILTSDVQLEENADDAPEEEIELPMDVDLQDLIDDKDANVTEVSSSMFQL